MGKKCEYFALGKTGTKSGKRCVSILYQKWLTKKKLFKKHEYFVPDLHHPVSPCEMSKPVVMDNVTICWIKCSQVTAVFATSSW